MQNLTQDVRVKEIPKMYSSFDLTVVTVKQQCKCSCVNQSHTSKVSLTSKSNILFVSQTKECTDVIRGSGVNGSRLSFKIFFRWGMRHLCLYDINQQL